MKTTKSRLIISVIFLLIFGVSQAYGCPDGYRSEAQTKTDPYTGEEETITVCVPNI